MAPVPPSVPWAAFWYYVALAFGLTWGLAALLLVFPDQMTRWFGELSISNPIFLLAVYAPAIAALLVVGATSGLRGLKRYLSRCGYWRCPPEWYLILFLGVPLAFAAGSAIKGNLFAGPLPFDSFGALLVAVLGMAVVGPIEEFGWRGVALPLLQRRLAPMWAALVIGLIWGLWHLPAFYLSGAPQSNWQFLPFLLGAVAISVIVTPLFNLSRGSILLPAAFHWQLNNPLWPDAQPWDTPVFILAALAVTWIWRDQMFGRGQGVTEVVPGESG